jgi:hypothetical protein
MLAGSTGTTQRGLPYHKQYHSIASGLLASAGALGLLSKLDIWANSYMDRLAVVLAEHVPSKASPSGLTKRERKFGTMRAQLRAADLKRLSVASLAGAAAEYAHDDVSNTALPANYRGTLKALAGFMRSKVPMLKYAGVNPAAETFLFEVEQRVFGVFCRALSGRDSGISTVSGGGFQGYPPDSPLAATIAYIAGWCLHKGKKMLVG